MIKVVVETLKDKKRFGATASAWMSESEKGFINTGINKFQACEIVKIDGLTEKQIEESSKIGFVKRITLELIESGYGQSP